MGSAREHGISKTPGFAVGTLFLRLIADYTKCADDTATGKSWSLGTVTSCAAIFSCVPNINVLGVIRNSRVTQSRPARVAKRAFAVTNAQDRASNCAADMSGTRLTSQTLRVGKTIKVLPNG